MGVREDKHKDYEGFVGKFKPKKTTDDCMTPPEVYDCILQYVKATRGIGDRRVVRPFWPGGDFTSYPYQPGDVVVDNPPFSILAGILSYYIDRGIDFWLFCPHLTSFNHINKRLTIVVCDVTITYGNGAKVNTDFYTSLYPEDIAAVADGTLSLLIKEVQKKSKNKRELPRYLYPANVLTGTWLGTYIASRGGHYELRRDEMHVISSLVNQRKVGKAIFAKGCLISTAAAERAAAERAAAERAAVVWELSPREIDIIARLDGKKQPALSLFDRDATPFPEG